MSKNDVLSGTRHKHFYYVSQGSELSWPNHNHNPNNKTTKTLVGLGLSKCLETNINPPTNHYQHTNLKL